jgi:uncharacterized membrane protein YeaQ/YmgE (transglycosylase-associated protein family)
MVIAILVGLIGALIGGTLAKKRKGKTIDIIQYAGIYFLIFAILGLFLNTLLLRLA